VSHWYGQGRVRSGDLRRPNRNCPSWSETPKCFRDRQEKKRVLMFSVITEAMASVIAIRLQSVKTKTVGNARFVNGNIRVNLDGPIFAFNCRMRLRHVMSASRIVSCKSGVQHLHDSCTHYEKCPRICNHVLKPYDCRNRTSSYFAGAESNLYHLSCLLLSFSSEYVTTGSSNEIIEKEIHFY